MIWDLILIGALLYLAVAIRGQIRHQKQMELGLGVRITSLETQIRDLQDCAGRIEDTLAVSKSPSEQPFRMPVISLKTSYLSR